MIRDTAEDAIATGNSEFLSTGEEEGGARRIEIAASIGFALLLLLLAPALLLLLLLLAPALLEDRKRFAALSPTP